MYKKKASYKFGPEQKKSFFKDTKESIKKVIAPAKEPEQIECLCCKNNCSCCDHQSGTGPIHTCKCRCHAADVVQ